MTLLVHESIRISHLGVVVNIITPRHGHVINDPMVLVRKHHSVFQKLHRVIVRVVVFGAESGAGLLFVEIDSIWRRPNPLAKQHLTQVFSGRAFSRFLFAKVEGIVLEGDDGLVRGKPVDQQFNLTFTVFRFCVFGTVRDRC